MALLLHFLRCLPGLFGSSSPVSGGAAAALSVPLSLVFFPALSPWSSWHESSYRRVTWVLFPCLSFPSDCRCSRSCLWSGSLSLSVLVGSPWLFRPLHVLSHCFSLLAARRLFSLVSWSAASCHLFMGPLCSPLIVLAFLPCPLLSHGPSGYPWCYCYSRLVQLPAVPPCLSGPPAGIPSPPSVVSCSSFFLDCSSLRAVPSLRGFIVLSTSLRFFRALLLWPVCASSWLSVVCLLMHCSSFRPGSLSWFCLSSCLLPLPTAAAFFEGYGWCPSSCGRFSCFFFALRLPCFPFLALWRRFLLLWMASVCQFRLCFRGLHVRWVRLYSP